MFTTIFNNLHLGTEEWFWIIFCAFLTGMAKTGIKGVGMFIVPVLADIFGGKSSTGLLLPMLCMADIFAVYYYHRHTRWSLILKLLPSAILGIIIGLVTGSFINDIQFKVIIAIIILFGVVIMIWREYMSKSQKTPDHWSFSVSTGLLGGFSTMIGNAAGPVLSVYLLSMKLPKNYFIGTGAWFFLIINLTKVPLHIFVWHTITVQSFSLNILMLPAIISGAYLGMRLVKIIPEGPYRIFVIIITILTTLKLVF